MRNYYFFAPVLLMFCFLSCVNNEQASNRISTTNIPQSGTNTPFNTAQDSISFKLGFFSNFPKGISGCGEYFTFDTSQFSKAKYIFLSNLTEYAFIKVDGKEIYLKKDTVESKEIDAKSYRAVYKGEGFKAVLQVTQIKAYDEGGFYSGTLQIVGNKIDAIFKVHGEAGC